MKKNKFIIIGVVGVILLIVGGCFLLFGKKDGKSILGSEEEVIESGIKITDINSKTRPYAVMINNISVARKYQSGLDNAYIVYEIIVEGGITRMLALFRDVDVDRIGTVRSARHYFLDYALENDAIYVHHGYSPQAYSDFGTLGIDRIEINTTTTGWRDQDLLSSGVATEHTLYTSTSALSKGIGNKRTTLNKGLLLNYSEDSVDYSSLENVKEARRVNIAYTANNVVQYEYDDVNKVYKRSVNGVEHTDYVTKKQYTVKNIITYQVSNSMIAGDNKNRQELDNLGNGEGWLITEGKAIPIKWKKDSRSSQTKYTYLNGKEIEVNDGNTFIQIQPKNQSLVIE